MAELRVITRYVCRDLVYEAGSVINVSDEEAAALVADAPGCFVPSRGEAVAAAPSEPPADKMLRKPRAKK